VIRRFQEKKKRGKHWYRIVSRALREIKAPILFTAADSPLVCVYNMMGNLPFVAVAIRNLQTRRLIWTLIEALWDIQMDSQLIVWKLVRIACYLSC